MATLYRILRTLRPQAVRLGRHRNSEYFSDDAVLSEIHSTLALTTPGEQRRYIAQFDKDFAFAMGARYAKSVCSGTSALYFALRALGIGNGDEVITVANTWVSTISAIRETGATCRFVDIHPATGGMDPDRLAEAITEGTRAIVPVHMYGNPVDIARVCAIAAKHRVPVVEDACQAIGAKFRDRLIGTWGDIGCYSFHVNKLVGAPADGGMIVTNTLALFKRVQSLPEANWATALETLQQRIPSRLPPLAVPVLRAKLAALPDIVNDRLRQFSRLCEALDGLPGTRILQPLSEASIAPRGCVVVSDNITAISAALKRRGFSFGPQYRESVEFVRQACRRGAALPYTEHLVGNHIVLPLGRAVSDDMVGQIVTGIRAAF